MARILHGPELPPSIPDVSLGKSLYETIRKFPKEEILYIEVKNGKRTTYNEFLSLSCRLARSLQNSGHKPNEVAIVSSENSSFYFVPVVASLFLGMISALLNQTYTPGELSHMLEIYQPKIVFCSNKVCKKFIDQKEKIKSIERIVIFENDEVDGCENLMGFMSKYCDWNFQVDEFEPVDLDPYEQVAVIMCSSGTTGKPKGVMVTHDNLAIRASQLVDPRLNLAKREIIPSYLPNFHVYGLTVNICGMLKGNTILIMERFEEKLFLEALEMYGVNIVPMVPTIACILIKSQLVKNYDLSGIEEFFCAGAPLSKEVEEALIKTFPNLKCLRQGYGLTEATFAVTLTTTVSRTVPRKLGSSGKVIPGLSLYVRDIKTGNVLGPYQKGEICVKGRYVTKGYYRNPKATQETFVDGWLHTGDIGYYDDDDHIFIVDRLKEMIKYKGFQISPTEIEGILISHPKVKAVAVVGKPDELAGELAAAFVVKFPGIEVTEKELITFVEGQLSKTKHLRGGVYFVDEIPKTPSGKIMKRVLKDTFFPEITK